MKCGNFLFPAKLKIVFVFSFLFLCVEGVFAVKQKPVYPVLKSEFFSEFEKTESVYKISGSLEDGSYAESVRLFCNFLQAFEKNYKYDFYISYFQNSKTIFNQIKATADSLYIAVLKKDSLQIGEKRLELLAAVSSWQNIEFTSAQVINKYSYIVTAIAILIILAFICIIVFYAVALNKSTLSEKDSVAFNAQIIKGQEEERKRIARELHDTVAQDLSYTSLLAGRLQEKKIADEICGNQVKCIQEIRSLCYNLSPPDLDNGDLVSAIKVLCSSIQKTADFELRLTILDGIKITFDAEKSLNVFRIVQELLNNICKHACASEVTLLFRNNESKDALRIFITDDGCGMEKSLVENLNKPFGSVKTGDKQQHFGVRSVKERARLLGGTIVYNSLPGEGTEVSVTIPL